MADKNGRFELKVGEQLDPLEAHKLAFPVGLWGVFLGRRVRIKGNIGLVQEPDHVSRTMVNRQIPALFIEWMSDEGIYQAIQILTYSDFERERTGGDEP